MISSRYPNPLRWLVSLFNLGVPSKYFRYGRCTICRRFGYVFFDTGEHEDCWYLQKTRSL